MTGKLTPQEELAALSKVQQQTKLLLENTTKELIEVKTKAEVEKAQLATRLDEALDALAAEKDATAFVRLQFEEEAAQRLLGIELIRKLQKENKDLHATVSSLQHAEERSDKLEQKLQQISEQSKNVGAAFERKQSEAQRQLSYDKHQWAQEKHSTAALVSVMRTTMKQMEADKARLSQLLASAQEGIAASVAQYQHSIDSLPKQPSNPDKKDEVQLAGAILEDIAEGEPLTRQLRSLIEARISAYQAQVDETTTLSQSIFARQRSEIDFLTQQGELEQQSTQALMEAMNEMQRQLAYTVGGTPS